MNILSITLGTRISAIAVLRNDELLDWQTHNFRATWSPKKAKHIVKLYSGYLLRYRIDFMIVKVPPPAHHSNGIKLLLKLIQAITPPGCMVDYTTKKELKRMVKVKNSKEIKKLAVQLYPELHREYCKHKQNKHPYYWKLFEAVLVAHVWKEKTKSNLSDESAPLIIESP